jgi:branched-subunit amino acid transport protein AzlD
MPEPVYVLAAVAVSAGVTWALRAVPFAALSPLRANRVIGYLSSCMPAGVMVILLAYCLRNLPLADPAGLAPPLVALAVTIGLHLWRRNAVLSIVGGTVANVLLASTLLAAG